MNSREVLLGKLYAFEAAAIKAKNVVIAERAKANVAKTLANALRDKIASSTHALTVDKCTNLERGTARLRKTNGDMLATPTSIFSASLRSARLCALLV